MATLADLNSDLLGMATTPLDATGITWASVVEALTQDHRVPSNTATLQISSGIVSEDNTSDGNANYTRVQAALNINYNTGNVNAQQVAWLEVHLQTLLAVLISKSTWRNLASISEVIGTPEVSFPTKIGDVVSVTVSAIVSLA